MGFLDFIHVQISQVVDLKNICLWQNWYDRLCNTPQNHPVTAEQEHYLLCSGTPGLSGATARGGKKKGTESQNVKEKEIPMRFK